MKNHDSGEIAKQLAARREPERSKILYEEDPELEREYRMFAQLLIDIYLWKREQRKKDYPQDGLT
ncbi:MAG TPA: hypothetical protein VGU23_04875 [Acidobacteriaceae bacterium]|nr:hypothetical protein [Acidobacteriaceae bacterium]